MFLLVCYLNLLYCNLNENSSETTNVNNVHIQDVTVEVTTTTTVYKHVEAIENQNSEEQNDKDIPSKIIIDESRKDKSSSIEENLQKEEPSNINNKFVISEKPRKCYVFNTVLDLTPILDFIKSKNIQITHSYNKYANGFSFCVDNDSLINELKNKIDITNIEEDKIYKISSVQYPVSRHLFLIDNYMNNIFNNYFFDNFVFRFLLIDRFFRYLLGNYTYYFTGKGTYLYMIDTTVNKTHNASNASHKTQSCNNHGNINLELITDKSKGYASDTQITVLDGVDCDGNITLSGILEQLEKIDKFKLPGVLLFGVSGPYSKILNDVINILSSKGLIVISPAGNNHDNGCNYSPGSAKNIINVGSLNKHADISTFSNFGGCVRVYSLGEEIFYTKKDRGTSFAAANIASAVLMFLEKYPTATLNKVWEFVNSNSVLNGNTHLVFKIPFLSNNDEFGYSSDRENYESPEIFVYYILPLLILIGFIIIMCWIIRKVRKRTNNEFILEPNFRHH